VLDLAVVRLIFILVISGCAYYFQPFQLPPTTAAIGGLLVGAAIILFEMRVERVSLKRLIGAAFGSVLGIFGAFLMSLVLARINVQNAPTLHFLQLFLLLWMTYVGLVVGANKGDMLNLSALGGVFGGEKGPKKAFKILDTSVIIDGRIADIAETGFLDGVLVIPQFVLRELQLVADSGDSMKRNRGRRGLDILQKMQKIAHVTVQIVETDFPEVREVDLKLIELARRMSGKIVTNDFNLNKVAQLRGVPVLNINELANSLKPVVLPGEVMRVFVIKEGKEAGQGVGYLDDGTMVVVDQARKALGKTIEVSVTSVLQTTAGKMIFCRWLDGPPPEESVVRRDLRVGDRREPHGRDPRALERREADRRDERVAPGASEPAADAHLLEGAPSPSPAPTRELSLPAEAAEGSPIRPIAKPD